MKKLITFAQFFIALIPAWTSVAHANHLDGLWRNDHLNITLRIEEERDGFKAKRTDEGIWYHYTTQDHQNFNDTNGNWYEILNEDAILWNEIHSEKSIKFLRVDTEPYYQWDRYGNIHNSYDDDRANNSYDRNNRNRDRDWNQFRTLEGNWYDRKGRDQIQLESINGGLRIKTENHGWEKFYADRTGTRFNDSEGNTITITDPNQLRWRGRYGKFEKTYYRDCSHDHDRPYNRD